MTATPRKFQGVWIPADIWLDRGLSITEKVMLVEIGSLQDDERGCYASNAHFAEFFGLSISRVSEIISALAAKALIGSKREATAMATAAAATKKAKRLEEKLGFCSRHATVTAVEKETGAKLPKNAYVALRAWCKANGVIPAEVVDERYGSVKAWPAGAWLFAFGIDLAELFKGGDV